MSTHQRMYGRKPPKRAAAIQLSRVLTGVVPPHPVAVDQLARLKGGWEMLGNDVAGCCVSVTWANVRRLVTAVLSTREVYPTQDQVWAVYKTQNPKFDPNGSADTNGPGSQYDQGMDIQTLLEHLVKVGGPDGVKALGFAQVDVKNVAEVQAAISIFGSVWTGVNVLDVNQQQFARGVPWDYSRTSPVDGGHSVITGGYGTPGVGALGGDERFITWAEETSFTDSFWQHEVEEAWVVIWPEHLGARAFQDGVSMQAFAADYTAITGRPFPAVVPPQPAPTPTPVPAPPAPSAADKALAASMHTWLTAKGL